MSDLFHQPENATPLMPEEVRQLIPAYIAYRSELNAAEQENIARAQDWALGRKREDQGAVDSAREGDERAAERLDRPSQRLERQVTRHGAAAPLRLEGRPLIASLGELTTWPGDGPCEPA